MFECRIHQLASTNRKFWAAGHFPFSNEDGLHTRLDSVSLSFNLRVINKYADVDLSKDVLKDRRSMT